MTSLHPFSVLQALKRDVQNFTSSDLLQKVPFLRDQGTTNLQHTRAHIPIADTCTRARTHTHGKHLRCTHSKPHIHTLTITSSKTRGHAHTKHTFTASESLRKDLSAAFEIEVFVENTTIIEEDTVGESCYFMSTGRASIGRQCDVKQSLNIVSPSQSIQVWLKFGPSITKPRP